LSRSNPYLRQFFAVRRGLQAGIAAASLLGGGVVGAALTIFGKIIAGAPPATPGNYAWNIAIFGVIGLVVGPTVIWSALRRAPLWRTVVDPLAAGVAGAGIAVLMGSGIALLALPPVAIAAAAFRLAASYPDEKRGGV
jgi:hypothetical protein